MDKYIYLDALMLVTDLVLITLSLLLQIMDIHSFMKLNFIPDISVLPQHTHTLAAYMMVDSALVQVGKNLSEAMRILGNEHW